MGSYIRPLSLLAYRLLGGRRSRLETRGRLAVLSEEGNHVLDCGLKDGFETVSELADALATCLTDRFVDDFACPVPAPWPMHLDAWEGPLLCSN
jgi:hypothetical protein